MIFKRGLAIMLLACSAFTVFGRGSEERGRYFSKKEYVKEDLPTHEEFFDMLPVLVCDGNPEYVEMYKKAWEIAYSRLRSPQANSPFVSNWLDEAFNDLIFQWDTIFMVMFARYGHESFPAINSLDNFYSRQHNDGLIWRVISENDGSDHPWGGGPKNARSINPPLFSWAEVESYRLTGDKSRFEMVLPVLEKYSEWIEVNRKSPVHSLYWSNGQASGMDNTPRDSGRPGGHSSYSPEGWVDMSAQVVLQYKNMSFMAEILGQKEKSALLLEKAENISAIINEKMWNERDGLYYDIDVKGHQKEWKTVACFWPMLAGLSSPDQNEKMIKNLKDEKTFWRKQIFPSLAADEPYYKSAGGYWHGGVWAPTNYMIIRGLRLQGHNEFAYECSKKYLDGINEVFKKTGTFWELYAPDSFNPGTVAHGGGLCRKDFVGWTGCGPIALLIENVLGFEVHADKSLIEWDIRRVDRHGIKGLKFGEVYSDLLFDDGKLFVRSTGEFKLEVSYNGSDRSLSVEKGENIFEL